MVFALAALAPKIIIPSFFIAHKVKDETDINKIVSIIGFSIMFVATVIILFQDKMPWIGLITCMSAVLFYQRSIGRDYPTQMIGALSLAIMMLTFYNSGASFFALSGFFTYLISFFIRSIPISTIAHVLGIVIFSYGVHDPSFLKEMKNIVEHIG